MLNQRCFVIKRQLLYASILIKLTPPLRSQSVDFNANRFKNQSP